MPEKSNKGSWAGLLSLVLVFGGLFVTFRYFDLAQVRGFIEAAGWWGPAVLIIAKASTLIIAPLGGAPLYPIAGALFGFWKGVLFLVLGDALGGAISFYISRIWGKRVVDYFFSDHALVNRVLMRLGTIRGLLVARIAFITFPELVSYAAGLTRIPFVPFMLIFVSIGVIPAVITAGLGAALVGEHNGLLFAGAIVTAALMSVAGYYFIVRKEAGEEAPPGGAGMM